MQSARSSMLLPQLPGSEGVLLCAFSRRDTCPTPRFQRDRTVSGPAGWLRCGTKRTGCFIDRGALAQRAKGAAGHPCLRSAAALRALRSRVRVWFLRRPSAKRSSSVLQSLNETVFFPTICFIYSFTDFSITRLIAVTHRSRLR